MCCNILKSSKSTRDDIGLDHHDQEPNLMFNSSLKNTVLETCICFFKLDDQYKCRILIFVSVKVEHVEASLIQHFHEETCNSRQE